MSPPSDSPWRREVVAQARLALPVVLVNIGMMMLGVVDTMMVGHFSRTDMAAVAAGHGVSFLFMAAGMGVLMALDPIISQAVGAGDSSGIRRAVQRSLVLASLMSLPLMLLHLPAEQYLTWLHQPESVTPIARNYIHTLTFGVPAFLGFVALRQTLQAMGMIRPLIVTIIATNLLNVVLNAMLIHGWAGGPALGAVGCGWATSVSRWFMLGGIVFAAWPVLGPMLRRFEAAAFDGPALWKSFLLGVPIAAQFLFEISAFNGVTFAMGIIGEIPQAANAAVLTVASLSFMVPLGIAMAGSVRVGYGIGKGDMDASRRAGTVALCAGVVVMTVSALLMFAFPEELARLFTDDADVITVFLVIIPFAAAFQVFDGVQVVATGVLRGLADVRMPAVWNLVAYWVIAMPLGLLLTFKYDWGARGLWVGLVVGLGIVAVVLTLRVRERMRGVVARLEVEG